MNDEIETTDLVKIFQQFGIYRNSLSVEHNAFVKAQLQKDYDTVTKTYELQGKIYTGTFREDAHRKENREAYAKEAKLATVLASMGFDVILIEEDNRKAGTKPDAIVNGIVMDFKEIEAFNEKEVGKNTLGKRYQDGIHKKYTEGVVIYLHDFTNEYVLNRMKGKTSPTHNGLALFFHEDTGNLQLIDMKKIRTVHEEQSFKTGTPPDVSIEPRKIKGTPYDSPQVVANPMTEHGSSRDLNLPQSPEKSSSKHEVQAIIVDGKPRTLENGLEEGFVNAVRRVDELIDAGRKLIAENSRLKKENAVLHERLEKKQIKGRSIGR